MTLGEYVKAGKLEVGDLIVLTSGVEILVGHCTPFIRPTTNDGCVGWDHKDDRKIRSVSNLLKQKYTAENALGDINKGQ